VLTSHTNNVVTHRTHSIGSNGVLTFLNSTGNFASTVAPIRTVIHNQMIYAYCQGAPDTLHITDLLTGTSTSITMGFSNFNMTVTPDHQKALIYNTNSTFVHIYTLTPALPLEHTYDPGISAAGYEVLKYLSFSADSQLVIFEYDALRSTVVFNLGTMSEQYTVNVA
jgi:hypothetical protein